MGERQAGRAVDFESGVAFGRVLPTGARGGRQTVCPGTPTGGDGAVAGETPGHAGDVGGRIVEQGLQGAGPAFQRRGRHQVVRARRELAGVCRRQGLVEIEKTWTECPRGAAWGRCATEAGQSPPALPALSRMAKDIQERRGRACDVSEFRDARAVGAGEHVRGVSGSACSR